MTKQLIPIMWLFLLLGLQSCGIEDEKFENIEFKTKMRNSKTSSLRQLV